MLVVISAPAIMGNKVNKVCSLDYNPLVSQPRARAPRVPTDVRARARGAFSPGFPSLDSPRARDSLWGLGTLPGEARLGQVVVWN